MPFTAAPGSALGVQEPVFEQLGKLRHRGAGKIRSILFQAGYFPPRLLQLMEKSAEPPPERGEELKSAAGPGFHI